MPLVLHCVRRTRRLVWSASTSMYWALLPQYTTIAAYVVTPVVALVQPDHVVTANPHEVADIFEVPLAFLMDPANHRRHVVDWGRVERQWLSMPYREDGMERFIWGVTAGILRNFYRFLLD